MKKAYIFDLDGTLLDSMTKGWKDVQYTYLDAQGAVYPEDILNRVATMGLYRGCEYYHQQFLPHIPTEEIFASLTGLMKKEYDETILLKPNAEKALQSLKAQGAKLCVLTAGIHQLFDGCLRRLGVEKYFEHIWSTEDLPYTKTDPNIYKEVARLLGVAAEDCVMLDDNVNALKAAKEAGFSTVGVYDEVEKERKQAMLETVDLYIYDFEELL